MGIRRPACVAAALLPLLWALAAHAQTAPPPAAAPTSPTAPVDAAPAPPGVPCLLTPKEIEAALGLLPAAGMAQRDARGVSTCVYTMPTRDLRRVIVQIDERYTAERFEQRVRLAGRVASATPVAIKDIGDGAFYVAGVAGTRRGLKYIEITGLRQAAARPIDADDAAKLLRAALERLPRF